MKQENCEDLERLMNNYGVLFYLYPFFSIYLNFPMSLQVRRSAGQNFPKHGKFHQKSYRSTCYIFVLRCNLEKNRVHNAEKRREGKKKELEGEDCCTNRLEKSNSILFFLQKNLSSVRYPVDQSRMDKQSNSLIMITFFRYSRKKAYINI